MTRLLNFGCGSTHHPEWVNLDAWASDPAVISCDVRRGFPFEESGFDAVYGSHVLEHLDRVAAARLLRECYRVLKSGGLVRLAVPDLEVIAKLYLELLPKALAGDAQARQRYDWIVLELYDQAVRTSSGGGMAAYLRSAMDEQQEAFVKGRIGVEAERPLPGRSTTLRKLRSAARMARRVAAGAVVFLFLGREGWHALHEGLFRRSGEVHQWMYDRFSMMRALEEAGFVEVRFCMANESGIDSFARYGLEVTDDKPRKPDSLYAEARKP